jgi:hypothetical protein
MVAKVQLIKEDNMYIVLTDLGENKPNYKTCFKILYDQDYELQEARKFGNKISKSLKTKLEENL